MLLASTLTQIHLLLIRAHALAIIDDAGLARGIGALAVDVEEMQKRPRLVEIEGPASEIAAAHQDPAAFARHMIEVAETLAMLGASLGSDIQALLAEFGDQIRDRARAELGEA
jgi:hypothetical protein